MTEYALKSCYEASYSVCSSQDEGLCAMTAISLYKISVPDLRAIPHQPVGRARQGGGLCRGQEGRAVGAAEHPARPGHVSAGAAGAGRDRPRRQRLRPARRRRAAEVLPNDGATIPELKDRIAKTIDFLKGLKPAQIDGTEDKEIKITFPSGAVREFTGQSLLLNNSLPNFYFHCTTAYDILRHCGIELGKRDFMGTPVSM